MAKSSKRRRNTARGHDENLSTPSVWRRQHGEFGPPSHDTDPDTGVVVVHRRAVDTLGQMLSNGTITQEMYDAGAVFRGQFRSAAFGDMAISALFRLPGRSTSGITEHNVRARVNVAEAITLLGGHASAAGSCVWHVVGRECSVREWAMRQGWGGRLVPASQAQGMLVAALGVLAAHYGLTTRTTAA